jgi:hypothetical protein
MARSTLNSDGKLRRIELTGPALLRATGAPYKRVGPSSPKIRSILVEPKRGALDECEPVKCFRGYCSAFADDVTNPESMLESA